MAKSQQNPPPSSMYQEAYSTIADCLTKSDVGFLIGAGMSRDSGIEIGSELAKQMLRRAALGVLAVDKQHTTLDKLAISYPFEGIAEYMVKKLGNHQFADWLCDAKQGGFDNAKPNNAHSYLHELWAQQGRKFPSMVFTTNFDNLIEDEFGSDAECITSSNVSQLAKARKQGKLAVVHLHGCVKFPDSIVFGEGEQATLEGPVFDLFRATLATEVFVMIGYSLSDTNVRQVFFDVQRVAKTRRGLDKRTFAVSPATGSIEDDASEIAIAKNIWDMRGVDHLAVSAADFLKRLYAVSDQFALTYMRGVVAAAMKKTPDTLDKMLESATEPFEVLEPKDLLEYLYCALGSRKAKEAKEEE